MKEGITIDQVLEHWAEWQIIDVRSPGEFSDGHMPGAVNIPLFSDEERAIVGTIYKQKSPEAAFREGLKIAGTKMVDLVDAIKPFKKKKDKKLVIHCWRGGKRSRAMEWLYSFSDVDIYRLEGGYKSYRTKLLSYFEHSQFDLRILGGCTGAGKTEILEKLSLQGEQVIDLEKLARHKGSAFGSIGEEEQPSTEQFENDLFLAFRSIDLRQPVWLENESKSIGRVYIPDGLWNQMRNALLFNIEVDKEIRIQRALKYYSEPIDIDRLRFSFENIKKRLGGLDYKLALLALDKGDLKTAAGIALAYYDKAYTYQVDAWPSDKVIQVGACDDVEKAANALIRLNKKL